MGIWVFTIFGTLVNMNIVQSCLPFSRSLFWLWKCTFDFGRFGHSLLFYELIIQLQFQLDSFNPCFLFHVYKQKSKDWSNSLIEMMNRDFWLPKYWCLKLLIVIFQPLCQSTSKPVGAYNSIYWASSKSSRQ